MDEKKRASKTEANHFLSEIELFKTERTSLQQCMAFRLDRRGAQIFPEIEGLSMTRLVKMNQAGSMPWTFPVSHVCKICSELGKAYKIFLPFAFDSR